MVDKFWELLQESVITQSLVTLMLLGAVVYIEVTGRSVPNDLWSATMVVLGFWFGQKLNFQNKKLQETLNKQKEGQ